MLYWPQGASMLLMSSRLEPVLKVFQANLKIVRPSSPLYSITALFSR